MDSLDYYCLQHSTGHRPGCFILLEGTTSNETNSSVSTILHDRLGIRKLTARWVPKSFSDEQMATRASVSSALLKRFRSKDGFLLRLVTVDETWVHYYEPENKAQSRQWVGPGSPRGQRSSRRNHLLAR